ncbi:hypothetical protein MICPUN_55615 [Micromonas commoda]|uniref:Uncharacterized protein n=1 Tax=Micromonas commoda (strain RCC299 / NOUM17 / CCMP2709) TaxID=296587 RepID=C1FEY7_MICCC|nr:hypothetical protein MICPUN_55615 [Micromonas commoda]ACO68657.1 hypothetical protein MICPUN_55615 [Micromonas commoda]|eukprot:XP_002507399.1 hypothetical protein MICPUN_55615 [Micromonas commoda]
MTREEGGGVSATKTAGKRTGDAPRVRLPLIHYNPIVAKILPKNPYRGYLPFSPALQDVRNVPELAARGVTQEMYARIFVHALAHVPGFQLKDDDRYCMTLDLEGLRQCCTCMFCPPCFALGLCQAYMNETRMQAVYERELRAWQENATAQLRTVIPGAVVKTQERIECDLVMHEYVEQGKTRVSENFMPRIAERVVTIALTPAEGLLLQDEPHLTGETDRAGNCCPCGISFSLLECHRFPNGAVKIGGILSCCCWVTVKPGAPEGMDYYEWSNDKRCATALRQM